MLSIFDAETRWISSIDRSAKAAPKIKNSYDAESAAALFAVITQCLAGQTAYEMNPATSWACHRLIGVAFVRRWLVGEQSLYDQPRHRASIEKGGHFFG